MRLSTFGKSVIAAAVALFATAETAFAGQITAPVVPEPAAIVVWAGIAGVGGAAYWWRHRHKG